MGIPASDLVQRQDVCHPSGSRSVHLELPLDFQARDLVAMHLVGPVRQPQQTCIGIGGGQQMVITRTTAAKHLDRPIDDRAGRSEEHTSELQSLMRISYAVFCLKKKNTQLKTH